MSDLRLEDFEPGDEVLYIPEHAKGDREHPDCRWGRVSSSNSSFIFVKFNEQVKNLGWEGTTSQGCLPEQLEK